MIHCFAKAIVPYHLYVQLNLRKTKDLIDVQVLFLSNNCFLNCGLCLIIFIVTYIETKQNCLANCIFLINIYLYLMNIFYCILVIFCIECFSIFFIVIFRIWSMVVVIKEVGTLWVNSQISTCYTFKIKGNFDTNHANYGFVCGLGSTYLFCTHKRGSLASNKHNLRYL